MNETRLEVFIKHANGDVEYQFCNSQNNMDTHLSHPYFGVVASNKDLEQQEFKDIDIAAVYVTNFDETRYKDTEAVENERTQFLVKKTNGGIALDESD